MLWNAKNGKVPLDNTEMYYVSFGYGQRALVLLPGLSDGLVTVKGKALILAKPYQIFFKDYRVYIFSRKNDMPKDYTIRDMAEDMALAMEVLGLRKVSVLGISQGGMIAQYLAVNHGELVDKLVIAVSAPRVNTKIRENVNRWITYGKECNHRKLMVDTVEKSYSSGYLKKLRRLYPIIGLIGKPSDYRRFLINARAILRFNAFEELVKIHCPTLIIGGEDDQVVGVTASYEMQTQISDSELLIYKGLGHAVYEEAKDFNKRVLCFLER